MIFDSFKSVKEFSRFSEVSDGTIRDTISGRYSPSFNTGNKIALALGSHIAILFPEIRKAEIIDRGEYYELPLTKEHVAILCKCHFHLIKNYLWCSDGKYAVSKVKGKRIYLHRIIAKTKSYSHTDHINGDSFDNRCSNLRECSAAENMMNRAKSLTLNKSGYKGVSYRKDMNKFRARIMKDQKEISLGWFNTAIEAAKAYDEGAKIYFGKFARLNFE